MFLRRGVTVLGAAAIPGVLAGCDVPFMSKAEVPEFPVEGPEEALQRLIEGNARYAAGKSSTINESVARRDSLVTRQRPFAAIFSCVDSRVPPELVFDRGLGDLFVIRTAGHVLDSAVMGSLEYGAYELEIPLLVVMGHTKCGAMKATIETLESGGKAEGSIEYLVEALAPAARVGIGKAMALTESIDSAGTEPGAEGSATENAGETATNTNATNNNATSNNAETTNAETTKGAASETPNVTAESPGEPTAESGKAPEASGTSESNAVEQPTEGEASAGESGSVEEGSVETSAAEEDSGAADEEATGETTADGEPAAVDAVDPKAKELTEAIKRNVTLVIERIKQSAIVEERIKKDRLLIVGAVYDIETGIAEFIDNVPAQFKSADAASTETTAE